MKSGKTNTEQSKLRRGRRIIISIIVVCVLLVFPSLLYSVGVMSAQTKTSLGESTNTAKGEYSYDTVIYGGTPSGIMAAVAAAREGLKVAIIEPSAHLGGIISSGLCSTDIGDSDVIGGLSAEFFKQIGTYYHEDKPRYSFEPHVAEKVFEQYIKSNGIDVFFNHQLRENAGVQKKQTTVTALTTTDNCEFHASVFIDSSYEGDLMAAAGVTYTVGRENKTAYSESLAGVSQYSLLNNFIYNCPAFSTDGVLLPGINKSVSLSTGQGDNKLPAYNYRLCLTNNPQNMVPFAKPEQYDVTQYKILTKWIYTLKSAEGDRALKLIDLFSFNALPNNKFDVNNKGPVSSDFLCMSWTYPNAGYAERLQLQTQHKNYIQGMLYFLATDSSVPIELRNDACHWGYAKDEFTDTENWPSQLYIRESRRMVSDFVLTQRDLQTNTTKPDSVGFGSFPIDSHNVQRIVTQDGRVLNEGEIYVGVKPYQLPYRIIIPKSNEASNLLITVCVSATHIAYSSVRMEPQYMILGQAAGLSAALAIKQKTTVQSVDISALQSLLKKQNAILSLK